MKKSLMGLLVVLVILIMSVPASAATKMGIGYNNSGTPLGMKIWLTDSFGLDFGVGFNSSANAQNFGLEAAVDLVVAKADPVFLELRGGMAMNFGQVTNLYWPLGFNIEYYVTKNLSLNMGLAIQLALENTAFRISSFCNTTGGLGVIYYF